MYVTLKLKPIKPPPIKSERLLSIFSVNDVNEKLKIFDEVLQATLDLHTPIKTVKVRQRPCPFVTPEIKELMGKRDQLHGIFIKTRDDWYNFKAARNEVKSELIRAHKDYVHNEVTKHKNNTGSLWKIIKDTVAYKERESVVYSKHPKIVAEEPLQPLLFFCWEKQCYSSITNHAR